MSTEDAHFHALQALEGFNEAFLESYMELSPDGEYIETNQAEPTSEAYLAVSADWLDDQYEKLKKQLWFRPKPYNRKDAEDELSHQPLGSFVVRVSSQEGHYAVSFVRKSGIDHMLILPSYAGVDSASPGKTQYRIGTYSTDLFNTVPKLVAYYIVHPFFEKERLFGIVQPEEQAGGFTYFDVEPAPRDEAPAGDESYLDM